MTPDALAKAQLRSAALDRRAALPATIRAQFSERLIRVGSSLAHRVGPRSASAFYPIRDEPDTLGLLEALAEDGIQTALPVTGQRGETLVFRRWRPGDATITGQMRIPEPAHEAPTLDPDLLFVPLAAFDRRGHRIGYGAGHYDRTLEKLRAMKPIVAVGVAYAVCEIDEAPNEAHDQALDFIITDAELIEIKAE